MAISENKQHTFLLVIVSLIFIIFTSGLAVEPETPIDSPVIIS
jgi:hypothetical protein